MAKDQRPRSELTSEENRARTEAEVADALDIDQSPSGVTGLTAKPASSVTPGSRSGHITRTGAHAGTGPLAAADIQSSGFRDTERLSAHLRQIHGRPPTPATVVKASSVVTSNPLVEFWVERAVREISPHQDMPINARALEMQWRHSLNTPEGFANFVKMVRASWGAKG